MKVNWDDDIPTTWKNNPSSKAPTRWEHDENIMGLEWEDKAKTSHDLEPPQRFFCVTKIP